MQHGLETGAASMNGHAYAPRNPAEPWGLCKCGFAEAAHLAIAAPYAPFGPYRCPDCVATGADTCNHERGGITATFPDLDVNLALRPPAERRSA